MEDFNPTPKLKGDLIKRIKKKKAIEANKYRNELGGTLINNTESVSFDIKSYEEMLNILTEGQKFESDDFRYEVQSINKRGAMVLSKITKVGKILQKRVIFPPQRIWEYIVDKRIKFLR